MAWRITGTYYAPCSCNVGCPCTLGELEADRGWCSGSLVFDILLPKKHLSASKRMKKRRRA